MILYLDFDGVLHPGDVYLQDGVPRLMAPGTLFMWAPILETALLACPEVEIVLSTSWAQKFGLQKAQAALTPTLRRRVVQATWTTEEAARYEQSTRYEQIARHAAKEKLSDTDWFAIDNDDFGWPHEKREHLIRCHSDLGLSEPRVLRELYEKLNLK